MPHDYFNQELPLEAKRSFIFLSLLLALLFNLLPLQGIMLLLRPDFVSITLLYWSIHYPQRIGMSLAFMAGLAMDVSNSSMLGQHALAYCVITFFGMILHRRLRLFNSFQQAPQIFWILLIAQFAIFLTGLLGGSYFPTWYYFFPSVTGALLWPVISFLLGIPQKPKSDPNEL
ncbi:MULTISPECIES: rod shape-determining protein MreD [Nitrosomonas]|uniref:Rod shape-determining protein MreD n=1 Tax=Nitrosomonas communis TaxID=44574 RepID=A0A0F7K9R2_9PROT|nr:MULTISPECIES: rod shape-determining protein MreD [Nitrosomonas]AKH37015.1 rod shape-determining protein MreD [Nitrosomonas communis]TYP93238.1 rod shape-determining protein MreD [Nitrosomonas communis]UVS62157.1 rod shape-determining protein MreD [Nitrosomonas sp. PLL12]